MRGADEEARGGGGEQGEERAREERGERHRALEAARIYLGRDSPWPAVASRGGPWRGTFAPTATMVVAGCTSGGRLHERRPGGRPARAQAGGDEAPNASNE